MIDIAGDVAAIFGDVLAVDAEYHPDGVGSFPVRVIPSQPDVDSGWSSTTIRSESTLFQIPVADAPEIAEGDEVTFGGQRYQVIGEPSRDPRRVIWTAEARPV